MTEIKINDIPSNIKAKVTDISENNLIKNEIGIFLLLFLIIRFRGK